MCLGLGISLANACGFVQVIVRGESNRNMCTTATVSVQLFDMNDNSPVFDSYNYLFNVNEGIEYGHTVGLIRVCIYFMSFNAKQQFLSS